MDDPHLPLDLPGSGPPIAVKRSLDNDSVAAPTVPFSVTESFHDNRRYGARGGPISGVFTGLAKPKKTTVPLPPKRVACVGSGTFLKPCSGFSQLFATHKLPAGSTTMSVMAACNPPT